MPGPLKQQLAWLLPRGESLGKEAKQQTPSKSARSLAKRNAFDAVTLWAKAAASIEEWRDSPALPLGLKNLRDVISEETCLRPEEVEAATTQLIAPDDDYAKKIAAQLPPRRQGR